MNRVNSSSNELLEQLVVKNKFLTMLSMRGMCLSVECLLGMLERFREGYLKNQAIIDEIEASKNQELMDLEQKYFRDDGENMAIKLLMKTKRRHRQPAEPLPI